MVIKNINGSCLYYNEQPIYFIREYYLYCIHLIENALAEKNYAINIIFGDYFLIFPNRNKTFKIDIQTEHTLVKPTDRKVRWAVKGNTKWKEDATYWVRIEKAPYHKSLDYNIEYSFPNAFNIANCDLLVKYFRKMIVIPPILYHFSPSSTEKQKNIITTFINDAIPRRNQILKDLQAIGIQSENVINAFSSEEVKNLYSTSKIVVNVHQTPEHDTFEELRVLPALLCGCVVVSENVPLKEFIPYHEQIIWADYEDIVNVVKEVSENYNFHFKKIFGDHRLKKIIDEMNLQNHDNICFMLSSLAKKKHGRNMLIEFITFYIRLMGRNILKIVQRK